MGQRTLFTVGHSTRSWKAFVSLLKAWKIKELIDIRTLPRSRTFPWFSEHRMKAALQKAGIGYVHLASLGGFRRSKSNSANTGWRNERFRGYADYMQTQEFEEGLKELNDRRKKRRVCVMCSEAVWWRCHRRMIADAEVVRGIPVKHVMNENTTKLHELTEFAIVKRRRRVPVLTYPGNGGS